MKDKTHMIISIDSEKAFVSYPAPTYDKNTKVGIEGPFLNIIKATYKKSIANIILKGQKLKAFPLRSGTRQGSTFTTLIQHSTGGPSYSDHTRRRNKRHANWKGGSKTVFIHR